MSDGVAELATEMARFGGGSSDTSAKGHTFASRGSWIPRELVRCPLIYLNRFPQLRTRSIDVRNRMCAGGLCRITRITKRETGMPKDPIKRTAEAYGRIARSPGGIRIVVETYLRLARSASDAQQRKRLLKVAAFYAELAELHEGGQPERRIRWSH